MLLLSVVACSGKDAADSAIDTAGIDTGHIDTAPEPVWEEWRVPTSERLHGVYASGEGIYIVGTTGHAWRGGTDEWNALSPGVGERDFTDLWAQGAGDSIDLYATVTEGQIAHHTGGEWTIETVGTSNHEGIDGSGPDNLYAVSFGGIYHFDGVTWTFEAPPSNERLNDVYGNGADALAVGEAGAMLRRENGTWQTVDAGVTTDLHAVTGTAMDDMWAVGESGVALHFDGTSWTPTETGTTNALWAVFAPEEDIAFAVGNNGTALRWTDDAWEVLPTGVPNNLYAVHGVAADSVWAVGNAGMALQFKD